MYSNTKCSIRFGSKRTTFLTEEVYDKGVIFFLYCTIYIWMKFPTSRKHVILMTLLFSQMAHQVVYSTLTTRFYPQAGLNTLYRNEILQGNFWGCLKVSLKAFHSISNLTELLPHIFSINTTIHSHKEIAVRMTKLFILPPFPAFQWWTIVGG